jgi:ABC-type Mn2+/Zn2+ transport system ATPase subunit
MTAATPVIHARDLRVAYGHNVVLQAVNLDIGDGEFWCLLGANGQGKTSFVRTVLGLLAVHSGTLEVRSDARTTMGFVPQRCDLNPTLPTTLEEFVSLGLVGIRASTGERRSRLAWALDKVGLQGRVHMDYWALSGGQRQRALVARALIRRPTLLILDEPTTNLDPTSEQALLDLLRELNRSAGMTILLVTHDIPLAAHYATHVALFHDGHVTSGRAADVLTEDSLARVFGSTVAASGHTPGQRVLHLLGGHH